MPPRVPPPGGPTTGGPSPELPRKRIVLRVVIACVIVFLCAAGTAAVGALGELNTLRDDLSINPSLKVGNSLASAGFGDAQTLLLVGNDQRNHTTTAPVLPHSNEMLLVRFDPSKPYISMMSIPRELMVTMHCPQGPVTNRLNFSLTCGGIPTLVTTIRHVTGIAVNHVVEIDFNQFKNAIDEMGCVYSTVDERYYHVNLPGLPQYQQINLQPGYQKMCGPAALSFVSYRHDDTSLVRDARDQSFLLDAKQEYGPTLVDNVHKFEKLFGESVQTDPSLHTTGGVLNLLGTLISSESMRVRQVQFQVTLQPTGSNPCSCDTASHQQVAESVDSFLYGGAAVLPKQNTASVAKAVHRRGGTAHLPLAPVPNSETQEAISAAAKEPFPLEFPRVQDSAGSVMPVSLRDYAIKASDGANYPIYVGVFAGPGLGQYYDVQGTTWTTAPVLDSPQQTIAVGGRTYYLYYEGQHLELVAWYEHGAAYWIRNTLTQALSNGELLAIAEQTVPATTKIGRPVGLQSASVPGRTIVQSESGLKHELGSLGGLVALVALPLLAIPLVRRRREVAKLRLQLAATLQFESRLATVLPAPPVVVQTVPGQRSRPGRGMWTQTVYSSSRLPTRIKVAAVLGATALLALGVLGLVANLQGTSTTIQHSRERSVAATVPSVPVAVLNATSTAGAAGQLARQLQNGHAKIATVGNLAQTLPPGLEILYAPGARGQAELVARMLFRHKPTVQPISPVAQAAAGTGVQVVVVIA